MAFIQFSDYSISGRQLVFSLLPEYKSGNREYFDSSSSYQPEYTFNFNSMDNTGTVQEQVYYRGFLQNTFIFQQTGHQTDSLLSLRQGTSNNYNIISLNPFPSFGGPIVLANDGSLGTFTLCFTSETFLMTSRGNVPVEHLRVGDVALTASGSARVITWIGHRDVDGDGGPLPHDQQPIRILAGAFGGGLPERDLYLSPGHPVLVGADADGEGADEVLVPIMCLINGTSIARVPVDTVTYWHVELDQHDILLAEGLPAESFLDYGNRSWFENGADHALTNPDFIPPGLNGRCRPVAVDGPLVEAERRRLDTLFHADLTAHCAWPAQDSWLAA